MLRVLFLLFIGTGAYEDSCERIVSLTIGQIGEKMRSPNHPLGDPPGATCRWIVDSPEGTHILLSCPNVNQVQEFPCGGYVRVFSNNPEDSSSSCRDKGFSFHSVSNKMDITYSTTPDSKHGWPFECYLSVMVDSMPSPGRAECNCGTRNSARIVGGVTPGVNEYPMMAALVRFSDTSTSFCGATIISEFYALTAAHCVIRVKNPIGLLVGEHDRSRADESGSTEVIAIDKIKYHEDYNSTGTRLNDIAIVHVNRSIIFHQYVRPACLPFHNKDQSLEGETVHVLGWGRTGRKQLPSQVLQKAELYVMKPDLCKTWFSKITETQFCSFTAKKSTCKGDSGGPSLWLDHHTFQLKLVGVHSYGRNCSIQAPNVETRVTSFLDWIETNAVGATFCKL